MSTTSSRTAPPPTASIEEMTAAVAGQTVPRRFLDTVAAHPDVVALRAMAGDGPDSWRTYTWAEVADRAARAAAGLLRLGVKPGERVLLMMRNRPEFHWLDLAAQFVRATPVSIYNSSSPEELAYLAEHSEARLAIFEDDGFLAKLAPVRGQLPGSSRSSCSRVGGRGTPSRSTPCWATRPPTSASWPRPPSPTTWPRSSTPRAPPDRPRA